MQITLPAEQVVKAAERALQSMDMEIDIPDDYDEKLEMYHMATSLASGSIFVGGYKQLILSSAEERIKEHYDNITKPFLRNLFTSEFLTWRKRNEKLFRKMVGDICVETISRTCSDSINCDVDEFVSREKNNCPSLHADGWDYYRSLYRSFCYFKEWEFMIQQGPQKFNLKKMKSLKGSVEFSYDEYNSIKDYL